MRKSSLILVVVYTLLTLSILIGRDIASSEVLEQLSLAIEGMKGI